MADEQGEEAVDGSMHQSTLCDRARYVERVAREMRVMALRSELGFLAYLLSMVEEEAATTVNRLSVR